MDPSLSSPSFGSGCVGELDGDPYPEIAFGAYFGSESLYVVDAESGNLKWGFYAGGGPLDASVIMLDVQGDSANEVVFAASWGILFCLDSAGDLVWRYPTSGYINCIDSPTGVADFDGDGKPELVFGAWQGDVYMLNAEDGSLVWHANIGPSSYIQSEPNIMDVNRDGTLDVVVAQYAGPCRVYALDGLDGDTIWSFAAGDYIYHGGSFVDLDGDYMEEIVVGSYDNYLYCLNAENGSEKWRTYFSGYPPIGPTSLADLDLDGDYEIIAATTGINVLDHKGNLLWSRPTSGSCFRGASVADMDGDGFLDLVYGADDGVLRCLRGYDGDTVFIFDADSNGFDNAPVIYDFNNDGNLDVFVVGGYPEEYGTAYCLFTDGTSLGHGWETFRHDHYHTGCFDGVVGTREDDAGRPSALAVAAWPNPARAEIVFSCMLPGPGELAISVYDPSGRLVWQISENGEAGERSCHWNPGEVAQGVYLYVARSGNQVARGRLIIAR